MCINTAEAAESRAMVVKMEIPFCPQVCPFCDKRVHEANDFQLLDAYADALYRELAFAAEDCQAYTVAAIKIGGGIAGHLFDEKLSEMLVWMRRHYHFAPDAEITLKIHPGMFSAQTLQTCRSAGINRLSVEYVTGDGTESERLGRFLPPQVMNVTKMVLGRYPVRLSFDVLCGLPGQSWATLRGTLEACMGYGATHIRLLPLRDHRGHSADGPWLEEAAQWLTSKGLIAYLPGMYAMPGEESRFDRLRCAGTPVLGLGAGALSTMEGIVSRNTQNVRDYCRYSPDPQRITQWARSTV